MHEWIGVGPSASSQYRGLRYTNIASLDRWATGIANSIPERTDVIKLTLKTLAIDEIIFGLRMNEGVNMEKNIFRQEISPLIDNLQAQGFLAEEKQRIRLTGRGRSLCDAIAKEIFNALE
jgi:oxygen-independent coproporphyrinogen-3 oxidase